MKRGNMFFAFGLGLTLLLLGCSPQTSTGEVSGEPEKKVTEQGSQTEQAATGSAVETATARAEPTPTPQMATETPAPTSAATAEPKETECDLAKQAYAVKLEKLYCRKNQKVDMFSLCDIDQDGVPELLAGFGDVDENQNSKEYNIQLWSIFTFAEGRVVKMTSGDFWHERDFGYSPSRKALLCYNGGTSNMYTMYAKENEELVKAGSLGHPWYDADTYKRKAQLDGKWVSEKKYKKFVEDILQQDFVVNSPGMRDLYLLNRRCLQGSAGTRASVAMEHMACAGMSYESSDSSVAAVNQKGRVKFGKNGTAKITTTVEYMGRTETYTTNVTAGEPFNKKQEHTAVLMQVTDVQNGKGKMFHLTGKIWTFPDVVSSPEIEKRLLKKRQITVFGEEYEARDIPKNLDVGFYSAKLYKKSGGDVPDYSLVMEPYLMNLPPYRLELAKNCKIVVEPYVNEVTVRVPAKADVDASDSFYSYAESNILNGKLYILDFDRNDVMSAMKVRMKEFAVHKQE